MFAADLDLLGVLSRVSGEQLHDVVVVDEGGSEKDELKIELVDFKVRWLANPSDRALLLLEPLGGFQIGAAVATKVMFWEGLLDLLALLIREVGVLVELGPETLNFLEPVYELGTGNVAHQVVYLIRSGFETLRLHKLAEVGNGLCKLVDDDRSLVYQPNLTGPVGLRAREESNGSVDTVLLLAEVENVAVGLGRVENAVGAGEGLNQAMVLEILVDVERVEVHGVEAGEEHIDDDGDVDLLGALVRQVTVGELLIFDALLDVLVVEIEVVDVMVRAILLVVVGDDSLQRGFLALGVVPVVLFLLREVFLDLLDIFVALRRRREDGGDLERDELRVGGLPFGLELFEDFIVLDGVVDRGCSEQRVETSLAGRGIVLVDDGLRDCRLGEWLTGIAGEAFFWFVEVDMKAEDILVLDRVGDGVSVELILEKVLGGLKGGDVSLDLLDGRVILEDRGASEAEELGVREELLDGLVVLAELRAVALVEDEDHPFVAELLKPLLER